MTGQNQSHAAGTDHQARAVKALLQALHGVYRLEAGLFDRFKATLFVSPVGEIL